MGRSAYFSKENRAASLSVIAAALMAALFLSMLSCLASSAWTYEIERIVRTEGDWQGRITGTIGETELSAIRENPAVKTAVVNAALSRESAVTVDLTMVSPGAIYRELPQIARALGLAPDAVSYHALLLSRSLIHDPDDPEPPLLLAFYIALLCVVSLALVLIIHNAFAVSMEARTRQLGILASIGATPRQIRRNLCAEAAWLCAAPILVGTCGGVGLAGAVLHAVNRYADDLPGRVAARLQVSPALLIASLLAAATTVLISAWIPARRLAKTSPLRAIRDVEPAVSPKHRRARLLPALFGVEGELASGATRRKALRTATLSITLSFLAFSTMLCFTALSTLSTNHTYFERYRDAWDVMLTVKHTSIEDFSLTEEIAALPNVRDAVAYQKFDAHCKLPQGSLSDGAAELVGEIDTVRAPIVVLDDAGFRAYAARLGISTEPTDAVILNRVWDRAHSNFRDKAYIPYVRGNWSVSELFGEKAGVAALPVLGFADEAPVLRESYEDFSLAHFIPASLWRGVAERFGRAERDLYVRVLAKPGATAAELDELEASTLRLFGSHYDVESENRIAEEAANARMTAGMTMLFGSFCALLALIGLANVFAYTLCFVYQRKREFARYLSVGMTPASLRKMFCVEALAVAGKPFLIALPLTAAIAAFMVSASHLEVQEVMTVAPIAPMAVFLLAVFVCVGLAYALGARRVLRCELAEALRG